MRTFWLTLLFTAQFFCSPRVGADTPKLTRDSVIGVWWGTDASGLRCRVEFDRTHGKATTFKESKSMTTVHFWWNIDRSRTNIVLGVSGTAHSLPDGELQLKLRPVNTNLVAVRDVIIKRDSPDGEARSRAK